MKRSVMSLIGRFVNWILPVCPNGGHMQRGSLVTNAKGNSFCWHPDCIRNNFEDVEDVSCDEKCLPCGTCQRDRSPLPCEKYS